jgi:histidyl-tRNA synthetase
MPRTLKVGTISGFPEWLPNARLAEQRVISTIQQQYELYGFTPIQTPAAERLDVLTAKGGMQRQIYTLGKPDEDDQKADVGLRFDLTVPLARYVVQHADELVFPFRRYQIDKVWRGEKSQRGRYREFYQCDVDIVGRGKLDNIHDAEIPCVINSTFEALRLPEFRIHVSNRKILADLLRRYGCPTGQMAAVLRAVDKSHRQGIDHTRAALLEERVPEGLIGPVTDLIRCDTLPEARKVLAAAGASLEGVEELDKILTNAKALGMPDARIRPDFTIARGLDYYTGTVYETFVAGKEDWGSVCSGGRYDDLASFFSTQKYPGVGISVGLSRLFSLLVEAEYVDVKARTPTKVLVTTQNRDAYMLDYLGIAKTLRAEGVPTEVYLDADPLRDQIGYASSQGIPLAIIAGGSEVEHDVVLVRDLLHRTQETVTGDGMVKYIREKLRAKAVSL